MKPNNRHTIKRQTKNGTTYCAFVLRCWEEKSQEEVFWRFSLECISEQRRMGFADLSELIQFLQEVTASQEFKRN